MSNLRKTQRFGIIRRLIHIFADLKKKPHSTYMTHQTAFFPPNQSARNHEQKSLNTILTKKLRINTKAHSQVHHLLGLIAILRHQHP